MNNSRKSLIVMFSVVLIILLAACGNASKESSSALNNQSQNNNSSQPTKADKKPTEKALDTENGNTANDTDMRKENSPNNIPAKEKIESSTNNTDANLKDEYFKKLNDTKKELVEIEAEDTSTYAMKKVEGDRYDVWDELLNEVYGVLKEQLSTEEMDQLRNEQRNWIKYRDDSAKEASLKFKGGTAEHLEYVSVLANLTEERCYELVEEYMK